MLNNKEFSLIMIPTTDCNCDCLYCFQGKKRKDKLHESEFEIICEKLVRHLKNKGVNKIHFYWQGGEVMILGTDYFYNIIKIQEKLFQREGMEFRNCIQSNLIEYDSSWGKLIKEHFEGKVGSSLDYPNMYRKTKNGGIEEYIDEWHEKYVMAKSDGILVNIISIPNQESFQIGPRSFIDFYMNKIGVNSIQLNFPFPFNAQEKLKREMHNSLPLLDTFVRELFLFYIKEIKDRNFYINPFQYVLFAVENFSVERRPCIFSRVCAENFMAIGPNGNCTLCDCWLEGDSEFIFGNLLKQNLDDIDRNRFREKIYKRADRIINEYCQSCPYIQLCFGGCPVRTYGFYGDLYKKDFYCSVYKTMFDVAYGNY